MERNTERKVLSFGKGMTNVPSDLMSEDNELEVCDGFIYRDGELKPVQKPVKIGQTQDGRSQKPYRKVGAYAVYHLLQNDG